MTYAFRPMTAADLPMANAWIASAEVSPWWDDPLDPDDLHQLDHRLWIVEREGAPFAFIQDYDPHAEPGHPFAHLPPGSRGVDLFIGEPTSMTGGHGSGLLRAFTEKLFAEGAPAVGGDPQPHNARAIRAAEKAGFVRGAIVETDWGRCLLMTRYAP